MPALVVTASPLLSVALTHDYYGGPFSAFTARALPATAQLCRRLGLRLAGADGTLTLFALPGSLPQLAAPAGQALLAAQALCWEIAPTDSNFAAFTHVDFAGPGRALVFSNRGTGSQGGRLTAGAMAAAADVWPRQALRFGFRPRHRLARGATVTLQTAAGANLRAWTVTDPGLVNIDASDFGSGLYQLAQGGKVLGRWFADERTPRPPTTGAILVLTGPLLAAAAGRSSGTAPPVFTAALPARPVVWRYHVFNAPDATGLSIDADEDAGAPEPGAPGRSARSRQRTQFHLLPAPVIPGAISFQATRALPLAAQPPQRFALSRNGVTLRSPLPLAGFDFARGDAGTAPCADILVHLQPQ